MGDSTNALVRAGLATTEITVRAAGRRCPTPVIRSVFLALAPTP